MADDQFPETIDFDVSGALKAGYSRSDIADYLGKATNFDAAGAREAGYSNDEIISNLTPRPTQAKAEPPPEEPKKAGLGDDLARGLAQARSDTQMLGATVAGARLADIEAAKAKADRGEFLSPLERAQADQYEEAKANTQRQLGETVKGAIQRRQEAEALPIKPEYQAFKEAGSKGWRDVAEAFWKAPGTVLTSMLAEGVTSMAPGIVGAVAGGPVGGAMVAGGQSYLQAYAGEVANLLQKRGVDINDADAVGKALSDPTVAKEIREEAALKAAPQGAAAAASMGIASRTLAPTALSVTRQQAINIPAQAVTQGALAAGGEVAGSMAAGQDTESGKVASQFIGGAAQGPVDAAVFGLRRMAGGERTARSPETDAKPVMDAPSVDDAIRSAREIVDPDHIESLRAEGDRSPDYTATRDQVGVLDVFGGLGEGDIVKTPDRNEYFFRSDRDGVDTPLRVWDPLMGGEGTVPPALVAAQREVYGRQGVRVVYFEDVPSVRFDGVVDPERPDTIFLSNKPQRNAAQVAGHELFHAMEDVRLPGQEGTLADGLFRAISEELTPEGLRYGIDRFKNTQGSPKRGDFPEGPEGQSLYADAITRHVIREIGADTHGEAMAFPDYIGRVIDKVDERYGHQVARNALQSFMDGLRKAMEKLRLFFVGEEGPAQTVSQNWYRNIGRIHDRLAEMDAAKFGEQAGLLDVGQYGPGPEGFPQPRIRPQDIGRVPSAPETGVAPPASPTPLAGPPETVRFYTGGDRSSDGRQPWLTADLREARMAAERNGEPVRFVDLPKDSPLIQRQWDSPDAPAWNFGAPERVAARFQELEPASSPRPLKPLVPDTGSIEESLAAHEKVRGDTLRSEVPRIEVPPDFRATQEEWNQAVRLSRGFNPEAALRNPQSLATFVRRYGGIGRDTPEGQDLVAAGLSRHPGLVRNKGVNVDWAAIAAEENGYYFGQQTKTGNGVDVDAFMKALINDATGRNRIYPDGQRIDTFAQQDQAREFRDYLSSIGLEPKGMPPEQISWILRQDPDSARTMALGKLVHKLGDADSAELAYRLDAEMARAQAEMGNPEPGRDWDMGDHRDLEAPTRRDLEAFYGQYERATGIDGGRPAEEGATRVAPVETTITAEARPVETGQPEAVGLGSDRLAQEVPAAQQAAPVTGRVEGGEAVDQISRRILDEADRAGVRADLERFAAGGEPTPAVMDVIRRTRGQAAEMPAADRVMAPEEPAFSPRVQGEEPVTRAAPDEVAFSPRPPQIYGERNEAAPYTPEQREAVVNMGHGREAPPTVAERIATAYRDRGTLAQQAKEGLAYAVIDPYVALKRLGDDDISYKKARMANDSSGAFKQFAQHGPIEFDPEGGGYKNKLDKDTGGVIWNVVMPLMDPVSKQTEALRFIRWMAGNRAEGLRAEGRERLISVSDEAALKSLGDGKLTFDYTMSDGTKTRDRIEAFKDTQAKFIEANRNVLELTYQSGRIDKGLYDKLKADPWWVSFLREKEDGTLDVSGAREGLARQGGLKKLTGGQEKLGADMWGNTFDTWAKMIDSAVKNKTARENLDVMQSAGVASKITEQTYNNLSNAEKLSTTWVMEDGKKQYWQVDDPGMQRALEGFRAVDPLGNVGKWLGEARKLFQYSIMANPVAQLRVLVKDQLHTPMVTGIGFNLPKNFYTGIKNLDTATPLENVVLAVANQQLKRQVLSNDEMRLLSGGGLMNRSTMTDTGISPTRLAQFGVNTPGVLAKVVTWATRLDEAYQQLASVGEGVSRMAVYKAMRDKGLPEWLAAFEARDVQDYSMKAGNPYVRAFVNMLPFANVHNIGLYKMARPTSATSLALGFAALTALKVANDWYYKDDEEFQKRPEQDRNANFWLKLGPVGFNIPTGFEVGALAAMSGNFITAMFDPEMTLERAARNAGKIAVDQLAMNPVPQVVRPLAEVWANQQGGLIFGGRPIESMSDRRLDPTQRYGAENTLPARGLSEMFNALGMGLSPKQIDHMVRQYTGWLGVQSLAMADSAMRSISNEPARPNIRMQDAISRGDIWGAITRGSFGPETSNQSRYVNMLYEQGEKIEQAYNTYRELIASGRGEAAQKYAQSNLEDLQKYRQFSAVKEAESRLNRQIRLVENSLEMTPEQKKLAISQIAATKNQAARSVFVPR